MHSTRESYAHSRFQPHLHLPASARTHEEHHSRAIVGVPYEGLFMRPWGDHRRDSIVKQEVFESEIRHRWRIVGVFDDRQHVVRMWRSLGLTVFQVAEGDY